MAPPQLRAVRGPCADPGRGVDPGQGAERRDRRRVQGAASRGPAGRVRPVAPRRAGAGRSRGGGGDPWGLALWRVRVDPVVGADRRAGYWAACRGFGGQVRAGCPCRGGAGPAWSRGRVLRIDAPGWIDSGRSWGLCASRCAPTLRRVAVDPDGRVDRRAGSWAAGRGFDGWGSARVLVAQVRRCHRPGGRPRGGCDTVRGRRARPAGAGLSAGVCAQTRRVGFRCRVSAVVCEPVSSPCAGSEGSGR